MNSDALKNYLAKSYRINTVINIIGCSLSLALFGFNWILLAVSYVVIDVLLMLVNSIMEKQIIRKNIGEKKAFQKFISKFHDYAYYESDKDKYAQYLVEKLMEEQEKLTIQQAELKKKMEEEEALKIQAEREALVKKIHGLSDINRNIDVFLAFYDAQRDKGNRLAGLKNVKDEFVVLKKNLEQKPEASFCVNGNLKIYLNELYSIMEAYYSLNKEKKMEYETKIDELLNEFQEYLKHTNEKVENYSLAETKISLEVLIQELREVNQKNNKE